MSARQKEEERRCGWRQAYAGYSAREVIIRQKAGGGAQQVVVFFCCRRHLATIVVAGADRSLSPDLLLSTSSSSIIDPLLPPQRRTVLVLPVFSSSSTDRRCCRACRACAYYGREIIHSPLPTTPTCAALPHHHRLRFSILVDSSSSQPLAQRRAHQATPAVAGRRCRGGWIMLPAWGGGRCDQKIE